MPGSRAASNRQVSSSVSEITIIIHSIEKKSPERSLQPTAGRVRAKIYYQFNLLETSP